MPLCTPRGCGCAFTSDTLTIFPDPSNANLIHFEQAEFTDLTEMQADIAALEAAMATAQSDISAAQTDITTLETAVATLSGIAASTTGGSALTTSGTTTSTVATLGPIVAEVTGFALLIAHMQRSQTVGTDTFDMQISVNGTIVAIGRGVGTTNAGSLTPALHYLAAVTAGVSYTFTTSLLRQAGTGTATTVSDARFNRLTAVFIPTI
jgi:hypothetical protein